MRLRVVVVGRARSAGALADSIRGVAGATEVTPLARLLSAGRVDAALIVLHTEAPLRELAALATLAPPLPPVLVVAPTLPSPDVVPALRAGARSLLVEGEYTDGDLRDAVCRTAAGHSRVSPGALSTVVDHIRRQGPPAHRVALSRREHQIMELLAAGEPNAAIAAYLRLAEKTVRNRVSQIYLKLNVRNRTEAIVYWQGRGD